MSRSEQVRKIEALLDAQGMHELPALEYARDALAPHVSAETLEYHHGKHHRAYVDKLNAAIKGTESAGKPLRDLIRDETGGVFNNAAQHFNHSFYWLCLRPGPIEPSGRLKSALEEGFGSLDAFREAFFEQAKAVFGSGWCWLYVGKDGKLALQQMVGAGCPVADEGWPLLTCDMWEHAYYIDRRNDKGAYLEAFWDVVDWDFVGARLEAAEHVAVR